MTLYMERRDDIDLTTYRYGTAVVLVWDYALPSDEGERFHTYQHEIARYAEITNRTIWERDETRQVRG